MIKIVIDTNVLISGVFFGGYPRKVLDSIFQKEIDAYISPEILHEYQRVIQEMIDRKQGKLDPNLLYPLFDRMTLITTTSNVSICRDPDDDKFLNCAIDAKALYVVSGDEDLLVLKNYNDIKIITAKQFCELYLI